VKPLSRWCDLLDVHQASRQGGGDWPMFTKLLARVEATDASAMISRPNLEERDV